MKKFSFKVTVQTKSAKKLQKLNQCGGGACSGGGNCGRPQK